MELQALKRIIDLTEQYKGDYIGPLERFFIDTKFPKLTLFFKLLKDDKAKTDDEMAFLLSFSTAFTSDYKKLKDEAVVRITHLLFFIDPRKMPKSHMWKSYIPGFKKVVAAELIFYMDIDRAPIELTKSGYEQMETVRFSEKKILALCNLTRYAGNAHSYDNFKKYAQVTLNTIDRARLEIEGEICKMELNFISTKSAGEKFKHVKKAKKYIQRLKKIFELTGSESAFHNYTETCINYNYSIKNYEEIIKITREADEWNEMKQKLTPKPMLAYMATHRLFSKAFLRDFENTSDDLKLCLEIYTENTKDWSNFLEIFFLHNMFSGNYTKAMDVYYKFLKSSVYEVLPPDIKERWKYFEPYLNFVIGDEFIKQNMDLLSFLNEISYYTEHKSDNNIPVLIAQVIAMIDMGDFKKLSGRTNYLENYINKYVDRKNFTRTFIFMKMLLKLFKNNFNAAKTEKQCFSQFKKIEFAPGNKLNTCDELEVIPYDILWGLILERIKTKLS